MGDGDGDRGDRVVAADMPARARAARITVADAHQAYHLAVAQRDALIRRAWDEGYTETTIADMFGIARKTVRDALTRRGWV